MEAPQGNSLCGYLKQGKYFFFYKIRDKECVTVPTWGVGISKRREGIGKDS
jgi:hypothetical protein